MSLPTDFQEAATEQSQLVPVADAMKLTPGQVLSLALDRAIADGKGYYWCSLPSDTDKQKRARLKYVVGTGNDIEELLAPAVFDVQDVLITKASWNDEDGRQVSVPKCIIINKQGQHLTILASIWVKQFIQLFAEVGLPPWKDPIRVSAKEVKLKGGKRYYSLELP